MGEERGSASPPAVAAVGVLVAVTVGALGFGSAVVARHRAQAAADLAALAAAAQVGAGAGVACRRAATLAGEMGARVGACSVEGLVVIVTVEVDTAVRLAGGQAARAVARAGPGRAG